MQTPLLYKVSTIKSPTEEDLDYAADLLIEAENISENAELYNNILERAKTKGKIYRNLKSIRDKANEMALNPGATRGEDDAANAKVKTTEKD